MKPMNWETSLFILCLAVAVLVGFTIPVLLQLRRTVRNLDVTITTLNQNLPQILKNVDYITDNIRQSVHAVRATVEETINRSLPSILENVDRLTSTVGKSVEMVRNRVEDLSLGVERFRGGIAHIDDRLKDSTRSRMSHTLTTFAGLVKRVRTALESVKP
jgi:uncharacterized protein YoxC